MKRWLCLLAIFTVTVGAFVAQTGRGQVPTNQPGGANPGDIGPGAGGATLRMPGMEMPSPARPPATPDGNLKSLWNTQATPFSPGVIPGAERRVAQLPTNQVDINKDFEITDKQGLWAILVMSYPGPEAPQLAREFVIEMRKTFKLNAYVFNYGAEEKRKEYERVQKARRDQIEALQKAGLKGNYLPSPVHAMKIDEHTGVLIANNYKSRDEALDALKALRNKFKSVDADFADRVKLDVTVAIVEEKDKSAKNGLRLGKTEARYVNPFKTAFPARNPAISEEQAAAAEPIDIKLLRALNAQEPLSLLQVKKPFTLVIKQFNTQQVVVRSKNEQEKFFAEQTSKGLTLERSGSRGDDFGDRAAGYAHSLAEQFRRSGLPEVYALHTKYCSFVTVGGYDSLQDPRMTQMQDNLESRFQMDAYRAIGLLERPAPMAVPH